MPNQPTDPTFTQFGRDQATAYRLNRGSYSADLYNEILAYHQTHGNGSFGQLYDVGCGPGNVTRDLATRFDKAIGTDPGVEMILEAIRGGGKTRTGEDVKFEVVTAEKLEDTESVKPYDPTTGEGGVDLMVVGMAAHWFDMPTFYKSALPMLRPKGTLAMWTQASYFCHPIATPHADQVQKAMFHFEEDILGPYELPGNRISRDMYDDLPLPWDTTEFQTASRWSKGGFVRKEWNRGGRLEPGQEDFFQGTKKTSLGELEKGFGSAGMVVRWREANPEKVGTEQDCATVFMKEVASAMSGGSVPENWRNLKLRAGTATALLLMTRSA